MNLTIGFCEIALVTSLLFYPHSKWIAIALMVAAILGKLVTFSISWNEKQERSKALKDANDNLTLSLKNLAIKAKPDIRPATLEKTNVKDFIFDNFTGDKNN
jgi:hypothetical protein